MCFTRETIWSEKVFFIPLCRLKLHEKQMNTTSVLLPEKASVRETVLTYTMRAFMERGIKSVTMDDIAEGLSMSKRTLYEMFQDKETLLLESLKLYRQLFMQDMERYARTSDNVLAIILYSFKKKLDELRVTDMRFYRDMNRYPNVMAYLKAFHGRDARRSVEAFLQGVRQGLFREDINYEIVQVLIAEQMKLLFETEGWKRFTATDMFRAIVLVNVRGICTPEGNRILDEFIAENGADW